MKNTEKSMEKLVALCKGRGFVYAGSEIYGGLANTWDYGPLGVELKENIKKAWRRKFIQENKYNVGLDSAILMNPQTWVASGHLGGFSDPLMDCKECKERFRADKIIEEYRNKLNDKVKELLSDSTIEESRILTEVTIFADKVCVDEEIVRLKSHIETMKQELIAGGSIGRKLDFIAQEMNREANTILSKTTDLAISNRGIELKTEIEKIREQIQNIE